MPASSLPPSASSALPAGPEPLHLGASYYPEFWGEARWESDFDNMRALGVNTLRVAEFAWGNMEPREGEFTLGWLDRFLAAAGRRGLRIVLCTPTATPPKWLTQNHPDTHVVRSDGVAIDSYGRKHYCPTSATYCARTAIILEKMVAVAARHPHVAAWQIDNEMGPHEVGRCFCPSCRASFADWTRRRYGTLEALNAAWRTDHWSQQINAWDELTAPANRTQPAISLDHARWVQEVWTGFYDFQRDTLRRLGVTLPITTNFMAPIYEGLDYWDFSRHVDFIATDHYIAGCVPPASTLAFDICRSLKRGPFWLAETGTRGEVLDGPESSETRLWAWKAVAHGARGLIYFRWRTCHAGAEDNHPALRTHDDQPTAGYEILRHTWAEMRAFFAKRGGELPLPRPPVALVFDWMALLAKGNPSTYMTGAMEQVEREVLAVYAFLQRHGLHADFVSPDHDLAGYRLVVAPGGAAGLDQPGFSARLRAYVQGGGVLLASAGLIAKDVNNNFYGEPRPRGLTELLGCRVGEYREISDWWYAVWVKPGVERCEVALPDGRAEQVKGLVEPLLVSGAGSARLSYQSGYARGRAALVHAPASAGHAFYSGVSLDQAPGETALAAALAAARLDLVRLPAGVERVLCGDTAFFFNHGTAPVVLPASLTHSAEFALGGFGVAAFHAGARVL